MELAFTAPIPTPPAVAHLGRIPSSKKDVSRWTGAANDILKNPEVRRAIDEYAERERKRKSGGGGGTPSKTPPPTSLGWSSVCTRVCVSSR